MFPKISVIVPAYNEKDFILECLNSLLNQDLDSSLYEIIVIDNASTDGTAEIAKKKRVKIVREKRKGVIYALIKGIDTSRGEIIVFTDADCRVPKNWLSRIIKQFEQNPQINALGGAFSFYDASFFLNYLAFLTRFSWHLAGGNMAIKKKSLEKVGGLDSNINLGWDVLLSLKLKGKFIIDRSNIVLTSARRLNCNFFKAIYFYFLNDLSLFFLRKPLFLNFSDTRNKNSFLKKNIEFRGIFKYSTILVVFFILVFFIFPSTTYSFHFSGFHEKIENKDKVVALTFDDGPNPEITPKILEILKEKNVKATFFVVGQKAEENPEILARIKEEGHIVGNHSFSHKWYSGLETNRGIKSDFFLAEKEINNIINVRPKLIRPPHGFVSAWFYKEMEKYDFKIVGWDIDSDDWISSENPQEITKRVVSKIRPGSVILFHDGINKKDILVALPEIIDELEKEGYSFLTVSEILHTKAYF